MKGFFSREKYSRVFSPRNYDFNIAEIYREAWQHAKKAWFFILVCYAIVLVMSCVPRILPYIEPYLPRFPLPAEMNMTAAILKIFSPALYWMFMTFPLQMALKLIVARIIYQREYNRDLLKNYFTFFWYNVTVSFFMAVAFILFPFVCLNYEIIFHHSSAHYEQLKALGFLGLAVIVVLVNYFCFVPDLLFLAKVRIFDAFKISWQAVAKHRFSILLMIMSQLVIFSVGSLTYHISDILLVPPAYVAWALLYRRIFGEHGLQV